MTWKHCTKWPFVFTRKRFLGTSQRDVDCRCRGNLCVKQFKFNLHLAERVLRRPSMYRRFVCKPKEDRGLTGDSQIRFKRVCPLFSHPRFCFVVPFRMSFSSREISGEKITCSEINCTNKNSSACLAHNGRWLTALLHEIEYNNWGSTTAQYVYIMIFFLDWQDKNAKASQEMGRLNWTWYIWGQ